MGETKALTHPVSSGFLEVEIRRGKRFCAFPWSRKQVIPLTIHPE
jgi:hypothetical protein